MLDFFRCLKVALTSPVSSDNVILFYLVTWLGEWAFTIQAKEPILGLVLSQDYPVKLYTQGLGK